MRVPGLLFPFFLLSSICQAMSSEGDQIVMDSVLGSPTYVPQTSSKPTLADLLTIEPSASIFYSYARELELSATFSNSGAKLTVFAPTNKAVMALARKPYVIKCLPFFKFPAQSRLQT